MQIPKGVRVNSNLYLSDCAENKRELKMAWEQKKGEVTMRDCKRFLDEKYKKKS